MCQQGRAGAYSRAQSIRRQAGTPSVQFSPVILSNFTPVLTRVSRAPQGSSRLSWQTQRPLERQLHTMSETARTLHG